jgi:hypothetical protein
MDTTITTSEGDSVEHPTHTSWVLWYHNPVDKKWDLKSYTKVYEFSSLEDFWRMSNNWKTYLPPVSEGMFFLMRRQKNGNYINPLWEDKYNRNGGFWSFKITKDAAVSVWHELSVHLIGERLCEYTSDTMMVNGISISPKRSFCIIKIWNNDYRRSDVSLLRKNMSEIDMTECMYKCHNDNIANDQQKMKRLTSKNDTNNRSDRYTRTNTFARKKS